MIEAPPRPGASSRAVKLLAALVATPLLAACNECGPQDHRAYACANRARGEQFCTAEKTFGPCICTQAPARDAGASDVSADR